MADNPYYPEWAQSPEGNFPPDRIRDAEAFQADCVRIAAAFEAIGWRDPADVADWQTLPALAELVRAADAALKAFG